MAEFQVAPARVLVPDITGSGVQFNQHVFAKITDAPAASFPGLEKKVVDLAPQFVRLFYNDKQATETPDKLESFVRAVKLAQQAGATINITWQSGGVATATEREQSMKKFASILDELVDTHGVTNLTWVTIQNEPNTPKQKNQAEKVVTPARLGEMYRRLDKHLVDKGLRSQIRFMGGDLIRNDQKRWFDHMALKMADILDAYSVHIYWDFWQPAKFEQRLTEVQKIVGALPPAGRKPLFITEYGVRGRNRVPNKDDPGAFDDGVPLGRTNVAGFQHAWFQIRAAQLGYSGTVKWDCFDGKYDRGTLSYCCIGAGRDGWPLFPTYFALQLMTLTTRPGWRILGVDRNPAAPKTKQLAAFAGGPDELTILGLDSRGAKLNTASSTVVSYSIGGLKPGLAYNLVVWNRAGGGKLVSADPVTADPAGVAKVTAPLQSVFALTTRAVTL